MEDLLNVIWGKEEVSSLTGTSLREFRKDLRMIFETLILYKRKNVFDNIALPLGVWGYNKSEIKDKVLDLLKLVGLEDKRLSKPSELSGGQKQISHSLKSPFIKSKYYFVMKLHQH